MYSATSSQQSDGHLEGRLTVLNPRTIVVGKYTRFRPNTSCCRDCDMSCVVLRLREAAKEQTFAKDIPKRFLKGFVLEFRLMAGGGQLLQQPDTMKFALRECIAAKVLELGNTFFNGPILNT